MLMLHSLARFSFYLTIIAAINGPMLSYAGICHAQRLFKPNFLSTATCIHSDQAEETAKHLFWECRAWHPIRNNYPTLMKFYSFCGAMWLNNLLHCGWILDHFPYGFHLLLSLEIHYDITSFTRDVHHMYLHILIQHNQTSHVLRQVPTTPVQQFFSSCIFVSSTHSNYSSPIVLSSP